MEICRRSLSHKYPCYSSHSIILNSHMALLASIPTEGRFPNFDICSAFFSIPADKVSPYPFAFTGEEKHYTWTVMPQNFTEKPSYLSQTLKADLDRIKFSGGSTFLQYVDDLFFCSFSQDSSQEDRINF